MRAGSLGGALDLASPVVAVIGGGGKTSVIFRLAAERSARGLPTLVTTTTHMWPPAPEQIRQCDMGPAVYASDLHLAAAGIAGEFARHRTVFLGAGLAAETGKVSGVAADLPQRLAARVPALGEPGAILVEADGAAGRPLKRYRAGEPAWPLPPFECVAVVGIDAWGRRLGPDVCHRFAGDGPARFGRDELLAYCRALADMARAVPAPLTLLFNRLDAASDRRGILAAARSAARLDGVARVLVGSVLVEGQGFKVFDPAQGGSA